MKKEKKIAIIAGNFREFTNFINFAKRSNKYIYADRIESLAGLELESVIPVGTWYERKDAWDILEFAKTRIR